MEIPDNRIFNSENWISFDCSRDNIRITGSSIQKIGFAKAPLCLTTGLPVLKNRQAVFTLFVLGFISSKPDHKSGKPFSAFKFLPKNWISEFFVSRANRQAVCGIVSCCPLTGKPVSKSGKPNSRIIFVVHHLLLIRQTVSCLSLKHVFSSLDFTPKSILFFHFHIKLSQENHSSSLYSLKTIFKLHFQNPKL